VRRRHVQGQPVPLLPHQGRPRPGGLAEHLRFWAGQLAASLDRARAVGYFRRGFRSEVAAEAILSLFEGAVLYSKASREPRAVLSAKRLATGYLEGCRA
jgi:hypothetical protein